VRSVLTRSMGGYFQFVDPRSVVRTFQSCGKLLVLDFPRA
jgi:hypothetical protein